MSAPSHHRPPQGARRRGPLKIDLGPAFGLSASASTPPTPPTSPAAASTHALTSHPAWTSAPATPSFISPAFAPPPTRQAGHATDDRSVPLSDLLDRASAQSIMLRRTLDDAAAADQAIRRRLNYLTQRLQQGQGFAEDFDRRLASAGAAAGVLERASAALRAVESTVERVRESQAALETRFTQRLADQEAAFEQRLLHQQAVFEQRLSNLASATDASFAAQTDRLEHARAEAVAQVADSAARAREIVHDSSAQIDRSAAAAQARVSLLLDSASDSLDSLQRRSEALSSRAAATLDDLRIRAEAILGDDADHPSPHTGRCPSLGSAVAHAESLVREVDDAGLRIRAIKSDTEQTIQRLADMRTDSESIVLDRLPQQDELRRVLDETHTHAQEMDRTLRDAAQVQAAAVRAALESSRAMSTLRDDLESIGAAARYHVGLAQDAVQTLTRTLDAAGHRTASLDASMEHIGEQATTLVALAREVAALIVKAEAIARPPSTPLAPPAPPAHP